MPISIIFRAELALFRFVHFEVYPIWCSDYGDRPEQTFYMMKKFAQKCRIYDQNYFSMWHSSSIANVFKTCRRGRGSYEPGRRIRCMYYPCWKCCKLNAYMFFKTVY